MKQNNIVYNNKLALLLLLLPVLPLVYLSILVYRYGGFYLTGIITAGGLILSLLRLAITRRFKTAGIIINIILCGLLVFVDVHGTRISRTTGKIVKTVDVYTVEVIKNNNSSLTFDQDLFGKTIGYVESEEYYSNWAFSLLSNIDKYDILHKISYLSYLDMFNDIKDGKIDFAVLSNIGEAEMNRLFENQELEEFSYVSLLSDRQIRVLKEMKQVNINEEGFTVLIQGIDSRNPYDVDKNYLSDVNMLVTINPSTGRINIQVIPRDSYALIADTDKYGKINVASWYGGTDCAIKTVKQFLNNQIDINYYCRINMAGFVRLVDALGGITINNPRTFWLPGRQYDPGLIYIATGDEALEIARARKGVYESDIGRGKNQMLIVQGILNKFLENPSISRMNDILDTIDGYFITTFKENDFITLFNILMNIKDKMKIDTNTMTGEIFFLDDDAFFHVYQGYIDINEEEKESAIKRISDTLKGY